MRAWAATVALCVALAVVGLGAAAGPTSAAWNDDAYLVASATGGTWSSFPDGGITPGNPNTEIEDIDWTVSSPSTFCAVVYVTGTSSTPAEWALNIEVAASPFNGIDPANVQIQAGGVKGAAEGGILPITGTGSGTGTFDPLSNNKNVTDAQVATVQICVYSAPAPGLGDPSWYVVTQEIFGIEDTGDTSVDPRVTAKQCAAITATGLVDVATYPFYFGWTGTLDLTELFEDIDEAGLTPSYASWEPEPGGGYLYTTEPGPYQPPSPSYVITSNNGVALRGTEAVTINVCIYAYSLIITPVSPSPSPSPSVSPTQTTQP